MSRSKVLASSSRTLQLIIGGLLAASLVGSGCDAGYLEGGQTAGENIRTTQASDAVASWSLLYYLAADNGEEPYADVTLDRLKAATAGLSDHPRILVMFDRLSVPGTEIFEVVGGAVVPVSSAAEQETSDPKALQDFVTLGLASYALDKVAVIFKSEGLEWRGIGRDNTHEPEVDDMLMSTGDAATALVAAQNAVGKNIDLLVLEGSQMAFAEVLYEMRSAAPILVTTQMRLYDDGIPWKPILGAMVAAPGMDGRALASTIVAEHVAFYDEQGNKGNPSSDDFVNFASMVAYDTAHAGAMKSAFAAWLAVIRPLLADLWNIMPHARDRAELGGQVAITNADFQTDLYRFMTETVRLADEFEVAIPQPLRDATDAFAAMYSDLLIAEAHTAKLQSATGMGIWFPPSWTAWNVDDYSLTSPNPPKFGTTIHYDDPVLALDWVSETQWVDFLFEWFDRAADSQSGSGDEEPPKPGKKDEDSKAANGAP